MSNQDQSKLSVSELCRLAHANSVDQVELTVLEAHALLNLRRRDWDMRTLDAWTEQALDGVQVARGVRNARKAKMIAELLNGLLGSPEDAREHAASVVFPKLVEATQSDLGKRP